jgi:hypothetical protein
LHRFANSACGGRWSVQALLLLCALAAPAAAVAAQIGQAFSGEAVKAAFVLRFAGYITWPDQSLPSDRFVIAILGAHEVEQNLRALLVGRSLLKRPVQVRRVTSIRDAAGAQILYVGRDYRGDRRTLLAPLAEHGTLVITEEDAGLAAGSAINLLIADQRVRFEISTQAARRAGLDISSDLLALAVRVRQ